MLIHYPDGSYVAAAIQLLDGNTLRAKVSGVDQTVEYKLIQNLWTSKLGIVVTFEFTHGRGSDLFQVGLPVMPTVMPTRIRDEAGCAAGGDCALRRISAADPGLVH